MIASIAALEGLDALGQRRLVVLARHGGAKVRNREPRVGHVAGGGDDPQVRLLGAAAGGAEVLDRRAAERHAAGQVVPVLMSARAIAARMRRRISCLFEHRPRP